MPARPPSVWALLDGLAGSNAQTRGVVRALGLPCLELPLAYAREWPWQRLAGHVRPTPETRAHLLAAPPPRLIVTTGRRAGAVARGLKHALAARDGRAPRLLHIQDPRFGHDDFDRLIVPAHDRHVERLTRRPNVTVVTGAPHPLTVERLAAAADDWRSAVAALPRPWIAVLVGGDSGRRRLDAPVARRLVEQAQALARRAGGSLMVTTSRRTRPDAVAALHESLGASLSGPHRLHAWTPDPAGNPYLGFLGLADGVIVTGDSMSMLTEATTPAKPLYIFAPPGWARAPHARFHAQLVEAGAARPLDDETPWQAWTGVPINPAATIAAEARALLDLA
ncbi:mitochondrial fission ELM1 family protein [uncultured Rhodospira sp.]|uniref:mitochondrial fission ELM1 family protein n=1 Tax=uncultured Rhodospira sp. TaxID=1936189 RepID=UPI002626CD61|nr:mitochondrial fission ELM1 family protein [uncultured Rhodospira sp.]